MSVKRWEDPAGLLPDRVSGVLTDGEGPEEMAEMMAMLERATPGARIERLRRHPELAGEADELQADYVAAGQLADALLKERIAQAENRALYLDVRPIGIKAVARQVWLSKPRRGSMPELDDWLHSADLNQSNDFLFHSLPEGSWGDDTLYRDGDQVVEIKSNGREHSIRRAAFDKRVTKARQRRRQRHESDASN